MNDSLDRLMAILVEKLDLLHRMQAILEEENRCITGLDSNTLEAASAGKELVFEQIALHNDKFRTALASTNQELGLPADGSLSVLIVQLKKPKQDAVRSLQQELITAAKKNEQLLAFNKGLLESSLSLIDRSMKFFSGLLSNAGTYGMSGRMLDVPAAARLVCKEM